MPLVMRLQGIKGTTLFPPSGRKDEHTGLVETNLRYMPVLEAGRRYNAKLERWQGSEQAPDGMVDVNLGAIADVFDQQIEKALDSILGNNANPDVALKRAVTNATMYALREIVTSTPRRTGRARSEWRVTLPDGGTHDSVSLGITQAPVTVKEWRAAETAKRKKRKEAAKTRRKGKRKSPGRTKK